MQGNEKIMKKKEVRMCGSTHQSKGANVFLIRLIVCLLTFKERGGGCCFRVLTGSFLTLNICAGSGVIGIKIKIDINTGLG